MPYPNKELLVIAVLLLFAASAFGQKLSVESLHLAENDLTARTEQRLDANKQPCALLKVQVRDEITKVEGNVVGNIIDNGGEKWVYFTDGTKQTNLLFRNYPPLNIYFPDHGIPSLRANCTYVLTITGELLNIQPSNQNPSIKTGFLIVNSVPEGANVYLDGEYAGAAPLNKRYPIGQQVQYRLSRNLYHDARGTAIVNQVQTKLDVTLQPAFGSLHVTSNPSPARVMIDDEPIGNTPMTVEQLRSGEHNVTVQSEMYAPVQRTVTISDGQMQELHVALDARFAYITIQAPQGATIKIDGQPKGTRTVTERLMEGIYEVEAELASHHSAKQQVRVVVGQDQTITLSPTPIYGSLAVESTPIGAKITLNDKDYGTTPNVLDGLLIGEYTLMLSKDGCNPWQQPVKIKENQETHIDATLSQATHSNSKQRFIDEAYERYKKEIDIDHFMLPLGNNPNETKANIARMDSIRNCILAGENWEDLVAKYSVDGSKGRNHGHYGFVSSGMFPYSFENVLYNTPVGEVSMPFKTPYGVHMLRVNTTRDRNDVHAKHILKLFPQDATDEQKAICKAQIDSIYALLQSGANFEELAKAESQDGSAKRGGDLGWFGRGRMVQPFEDIAFSLADGEISEPFATKYGYHIIMKVAHGIPPLSEVSSSIENAISQDERALLINDQPTSNKSRP